MTPCPSRALLPLFSCLVLLAAAGSFVRAAESWSAGAARISITPEQPMWMSGYGSRDKPAEGKLTELYAKALVVQDPHGERVALVTLDLVGIDRPLTERICGDLQAKYGLERRQIALATSHTHTGPAVGQNLRAMLDWRLNEVQRAQIDRYSAELQGKVVQVVGEALQKLAPSRLSWGQGTATFAVNRRENQEPAVPDLRRDGVLRGPSDHDVPVLAVHDLDGKLTAVAFGYACHATVLSFFQWSGDYPGFAQQFLEAAHPDCVALFWAGCGADQNPLPRRTVELAEHYGRRLADAVDSVLLTTSLRPVEGKLATDYREIPLPFAGLPTREQLEQDAQSQDSYVASRAGLLLREMQAGQALQPAYPYPIQTWQLGQVQFIILGGEVVVDYAIRLKAELQGPRTWVAGYSNDVMAYIPSRRVLQEGGYEGGGSMVYYGLPAHWAPELEEAIVAEVHRQLGSGK